MRAPNLSLQYEYGQLKSNTVSASNSKNMRLLSETLFPTIKEKKVAIERSETIKKGGGGERDLREVKISSWNPHFLLSFWDSKSTFNDS